MPRLPYMNFPFPFYKTSPYPPSSIYNIAKAHQKDNYSNTGKSNSISSSSYESSCDYTEKNSFLPFNEKNKSNKYNNDYLFDLFGLKIYYDDVLLISLIYFLYSEGVKDDGLFIVLVLLLLS